MADGLMGNINHIDNLLRTGEAYTDFKKIGLSALHLAKQKVYICESGDHTCSVCLLNTKVGEFVFELTCNHIFHKACIEPWFKKSSICPNCRHDLTSKVP